jgi:hypothetical protein
VTMRIDYRPNDGDHSCREERYDTYITLPMSFAGLVAYV